MAAELDEMVEGFRGRPLDAGPYTFAWTGALTQKVREGGRTVNVHALIATAVNAGGKREILGIEVASSEDGAGWLAFLRGLAALQDPLPPQPAHQGAQVRPAVGVHPGAHHLRAARRRLGPGPAPPRRRCARGQVPAGRNPSRRCP